jgi:mannan endo-1,4-beta-mannosidase
MSGYRPVPRTWADGLSYGGCEATRSTSARSASQRGSHVNRSLSAVIAVLAVAVTAIGVFVLAGGYGHRSRGQALPAASPVSDTGHTLAQAPAVSASGNASPTAGAPSPRPTRVRVLTPRARTVGPFIGVAIQAHISHSMNDFARLTHAHLALGEIYTGFGAPFPLVQASRIIRHGGEPFIQWNPKRAPLRKIERGRFNGYIRWYARAVKAFKQPIILSFGHEMNGSWNRWSRPHATPRQFRRSWRMIHRVFNRNGVHNVTWSWDPSHTGRNSRPYWPGGRWVDRVGVDGYFRHGQRFKEIFAKRLAEIRRFTHRPIFIAETAVARGPGQNRQIREIFSGVRRNHLGGFVWFNVNHLKVWRLDGRPGAIRTFRREVAIINRSRYVPVSATAK